MLNPCMCQVLYKSKWTLYLETFFLILILVGGFWLLFFIVGRVFGIKVP